jgi:hypothetical protein
MPEARQAAAAAILQLLRAEHQDDVVGARGIARQALRNASVPVAQ